MTIEAKEKHKQEKGSTNKYYRPTRHISWIEIIPKYISPREAAALSTEEKEKLLKPFERPRFSSPDFPPITGIRLFSHFFCQDPRPIPDTRKKWKLDLYIQNKELNTEKKSTKDPVQLQD